MTGNIVDQLSQSENPKHRNSKFLKFLLKLNHGVYSMENDNLVKHPEKSEDFRTSYTKMRDDWQKEIVARQAQMNAMMGEEEKKDVEEAKQEEEEGPE